MAEDVCVPVAHRQVVLTIPKRLRLHTRFDRKLLGKLCACAWTCIQAEVRRQLGRDDVTPGMIAAIQSPGGNGLKKGIICGRQVGIRGLGMLSSFGACA